MHVGSANSNECVFASHTVTSSDVVSQVFARPLDKGRLAVVLLNRAESATKLSVTWDELGVSLELHTLKPF